MPREITVTAYKFNELSDRAKENAREWYRNSWRYDWGNNNIGSLKSFCDWFNVKITDYSLGGSYNRNYVKFDVCIDDSIKALKGVRLWKWFTNNTYSLPDLSGNCPFTGYCFDETLLDEIRAFMKRPWYTDYEDLIERCIDKFIKAYEQDYDYNYSDECIDESMELNEYEFTADGEIA